MKANTICMLLLLALLPASLALAQEEAPFYVGDVTCGSCHQEKYIEYQQSGHPWKISDHFGVQPPADFWPFTPIPPVPATLGVTEDDWENVFIVIGNFFWKTRFIEPDGFIHTGDEVQWNIADQEFVAYHPGEERPFNCGRCHTTGYSPEGNQYGLPGLVGTWTEPGIRCEACHGPGSEHVGSFGTVPPPGGKDCSECHYRDADFRMPWSGGFMRHHQQSEDLAHSPHDALGCNTCHDPHKSVVYDLGGTITECSDCHAGDEANRFYAVEGMEFLDCVDCHMPKMGKSASAVNAYKADISGHIFRITTDPIAAADNTYQVDGSTFWNQDDQGQSVVTLDYACFGCHLDAAGEPVFTLEQAAEFAKGVHAPKAVEPGGGWTVKLVGGDEFNVAFEEFAGILIVTTTHPDESTSVGVGMRIDNTIFWMDASGALFFGNVNDAKGTMMGIVFGPLGNGTMWFAEQNL